MEKVYKFNGMTLAIMLMNQQLLFNAKDVSEILGYSQTQKAIKILDDDEKLITLIGRSGQKRKTWMLTESGLYHLILKSTKPEAKKFRKWVTAEVLPAIRKAGYYAKDNVSQKQAKLEELMNLIDSKELSAKALNTEIKRLKAQFRETFDTDPNQLQIFAKAEMDKLKVN